MKEEFQKLLDCGIITHDSETRTYTVWDETFSNEICITWYPLIAVEAHRIYCNNYLKWE